MMNKGGAPKKDIDFSQLKSLCEIQCTGEEVASVFGIDYDTLNARIKEHTEHSGFSDYFKANNGTGQASLRRVQWESALDGSAAMQIWLGKQWLGQADKLESKITEKKELDLTDDQLITELEKYGIKPPNSQPPVRAKDPGGED